MRIWLAVLTAVLVAGAGVFIWSSRAPHLSARELAWREMRTAAMDAPTLRNDAPMHPHILAPPASSAASIRGSCRASHPATCREGDYLKIDRQFRRELRRMVGYRRRPSYDLHGTAYRTLVRAMGWSPHVDRIGDFYALEGFEPHDSSSWEMVVESGAGRMIAVAVLEYNCWAPEGAGPCRREDPTPKACAGINPPNCRLHGSLWVFVRDPKRHREVTKEAFARGEPTFDGNGVRGLLQQRIVVPVY